MEVARCSLVKKAHIGDTHLIPTSLNRPLQLAGRPEGDATWATTATIEAGYAECARRSCVRRSAIVFSSPGCSMNEFMINPLSLLARTTDGLPARNCCAASRGCSEMWRGSQ